MSNSGEPANNLIVSEGDHVPEFEKYYDVGTGIIQIQSNDYQIEDNEQGVTIRLNWPVSIVEVWTPPTGGVSGA